MSTMARLEDRTLLQKSLIGIVLATLLLAMNAVGLVESLLIIGLFLAALIIFRWPEYGIALLVAGTVTNIFGVASNVHGLPGIQLRLTFGLAFVLLVRWAFGREKPARAWAFLPILVLAYGVSLLSLVHVENLDPTLEKLTEQVRDMSTVVVLALSLTSRDRLILAIKLTVLSMGIVAMLGVGQYLTGSFDQNMFGLSQASMKQIAGSIQQWRISGALPDPNYYGQVLAMTLPLALFLAIYEKPILWRIAYSLCAVAILAASLLTFSRGTIFAIAAMAVASILTLRARWWLLGFALMIGCLGLFAMPSAFIDRIALIAQAGQNLIMGEQAVSDPSLSSRIAVMSTALYMFLDHPFVGIGLGQYPILYNQYALALGVNPGAEPNAHSLYLETLAEEGIAGFVKLGMLIILAFKVCLRSVRYFSFANQKHDASIALSLCISFVGYLASAVFLHGAFIRFFWIEIALLLSLSNLSYAATPRPWGIRKTDERSSNMIHRALAPIDFVGVLRERKLLIAATTLAFMAVSLIATPQFTAESTLLYRFGREYFPIRPGEEHRNWGENVQVSLDAALFTEMHLLRSREVIESTISKVGLDKLATSQKSLLDQMQGNASGIANDVLALSKNIGAGSTASPSKRDVDPAVAIAKSLAERLRIRRVEGAAMIAVGIQDPDPELAEQIVAAHIESYLAKRQQLFERDPSNFYTAEIAKAQAELSSISEKMSSLRLEQGVPDEAVEHSVLSDRLIALERQRQSMGQADVPILLEDIKKTREALFNLNAMTSTMKLLEARYKTVTESLERMLQEQHRSRLDSAYVRELGPTIEIVEPASFSSRPSGFSRPVRMILGGVIGFMIITAFLMGYAALVWRKKDSFMSDHAGRTKVKVVF